MGHGQAPTATLCHSGQGSGVPAPLWCHRHPVPPPPLQMTAIPPVPSVPWLPCHTWCHETGAMPAKVMVCRPRHSLWHGPRASGSPWLTLSSFSASCTRCDPVALRTAPSHLPAGMAISSRLALWEQKESLGPGWHQQCFGAGCSQAARGLGAGWGDAPQPACRTPLGSASPRLPTHVAHAVSNPASSGHLCRLNVLVWAILLLFKACSSPQGRDSGVCRAWCWCCCAVVRPGKPFAVGAVGSGAGFQLGAWHGGTCRSACGRGDARRHFLTRCSWDGSSHGHAGAAGCRAEPAEHVGSPQHPALGGVWKLRSFSVGLFFVLFLPLSTAPLNQSGAHGWPMALLATCRMPVASPTSGAGC